MLQLAQYTIQRNHPGEGRAAVMNLYGFSLPLLISGAGV